MTIVKATEVRKSHAVGIVAETIYKMQAPDRVLEVSTQKCSAGYIYTYAQVYKVERGGKSFIMFQDYRKNVADYKAVRRATEKSVLECHKASLTNIEQFLNEANEQYKHEVLPESVLTVLTPDELAEIIEQG